jgi:hypothetical protein
MIDVVSFDPGTRNFGCSHVRVSVVRGRVIYQVVQNGLFRSTITSLNQDLISKSARFDSKIEPLLIRCDILAAERFMSRGLRGTLIENITYMLGRVSRTLDLMGKPYRYIAAVTWKNAINKELKSLDLNLKDLYGLCKAEPHQLDSVLIGIYIGSLHLGAKPFQQFTSKTAIRKLFKQVESTSREPLINRRNRL